MKTTSIFVIFAAAVASLVAVRGSTAADASKDATAIRSFTVPTVSQAALDDLRLRIAATRWPEKETVDDQSQGVQLATMQKLASYWGKSYDWRKCEAKLEALPHFVTNIDGLDIHFIHVRSKNPNALPMIITHGWPGSIIEQLKIIDPLTNPTAHGGKAEDSFDVVIPSLPGYGYSGKPTTTGWDPIRTARAWVELMKRLGYKKYVAQGGDWGNAVTEQMALLAPTELVGIHTNMPAAVPPDVDKAALAGAPAPSDLSSEEKHAYDQLAYFYKHGLGYAQEMANRPQTLYALADSPVGLAAWMCDHDAASMALISRVFDGQSEGLTKDDILDNITFYWFTNTAVSSARLYWESKLAFFAPKGVAIPAAISAFPDELYQAPKSWTEKAYPKLIYYNKLPKGGHFAAWEQPELFVNEMRAGFKTFMTQTTTTQNNIGQAGDLVFETLTVRKEGAVLFVEILSPPMNLLGPELVRDLVSLIQRAEADDSVYVLVFKSADPDFFISHVDVNRIKEYRAEAAKLTGEASIALLFRHLSASRLVTIAQIEGRVRGAGSEFVLACDMRFAARESAIFGQFEPAFGSVPGGGATQHLARLMGRARAMEVLLSADDYEADLAERYGWINRALPAAELGDFVKSLAHRIARFPAAGHVAVKERVNAIALAPVEEFRHDSDLFGESNRQPEVQRRLQAAMKRGFQTRAGEINLGRLLGELEEK